MLVSGGFFQGRGFVAFGLFCLRSCSVFCGIFISGDLGFLFGLLGEIVGDVFCSGGLRDLRGF